MKNNGVVPYNYRNEFKPAVQQNKSVTSDMMMSRQAQEVQVAMVVAKNFPRNEGAAFDRIMCACSRTGLAEKALYEFPRGGSKVEGPSVHLARVLAQAWGNIDSGYIELEQKNGESHVMAYCWDLETNVRETKVFSVPHVRDTKNGRVKLTDARDIYEAVANQAARRVRSCILNVIPEDVVTAAVEKCKETLLGDDNLAERIDNMARMYWENLGVPTMALEQYVGCKISAFTPKNIAVLGNIYNNIIDGRADASQYFKAPAAEENASDKSDAPDKKATTKKNKAATGDSGEVVNLADL